MLPKHGEVAMHVYIMVNWLNCSAICHLFSNVFFSSILLKQEKMQLEIVDSMYRVNSHTTSEL